MCQPQRAGSACATSTLVEADQVPHDAAAQGAEVVPAFQHADDPAARNGRSATSTSIRVICSKPSSLSSIWASGSSRWASKPAEISRTSGRNWSSVGHDALASIARGSRRRRAGVEGDVEREAAAGAVADFPLVAAAGVAGARVLVQADEEDASDRLRRRPACRCRGGRRNRRWRFVRRRASAADIARRSRRWRRGRTPSAGPARRDGPAGGPRRKARFTRPFITASQQPRSGAERRAARSRSSLAPTGVSP